MSRNNKKNKESKTSIGYNNKSNIPCKNNNNTKRKRDRRKIY